MRSNIRTIIVAVEWFMNWRESRGTGAGDEARLVVVALHARQRQISAKGLQSADVEDDDGDTQAWTYTCTYHT